MTKMNDPTTLAPGITQTVAYTGTHGAISNAVGAHTHIVRILCTTDAFIEFLGTPVATTSDMPVTGGQPEYFNISPGAKVSAIQRSSGGDLYVTEMSK